MSGCAERECTRVLRSFESALSSFPYHDRSRHGTGLVARSERERCFPTPPQPFFRLHHRFGVRCRKRQSDSWSGLIGSRQMAVIPRGVSSSSNVTRRRPLRVDAKVHCSPPDCVRAQRAGALPLLRFPPGVRSCGVLCPGGALSPCAEELQA